MKIFNMLKKKTTKLKMNKILTRIITLKNNSKTTEEKINTEKLKSFL